MGPSPTYHPPEGEECETSVEHGLPLWAEPAVGYCSRRPRPSPMWGSRFVGAPAVGLGWVSKSPLVSPPCGATPVPSRPTYLHTYVKWAGRTRGGQERRGTHPFSDLVGRKGRPRERGPEMEEGRWRRMLGEALPGVSLDCLQEKEKKPRVRMLWELLQGQGWYGGDA